MAITPLDILSHAKQLPLEQEVDLRTAINRAYYASFHAARIFHEGLSAPGVMSPTGGIHECLCHQLVNPTIPKEDPLYVTSRRVGMLVKDLKVKRTTTDYDLLSDSVNTELAQYVFAQTTKVFALAGIVE